MLKYFIKNNKKNSVAGKHKPEKNPNNLISSSFFSSQLWFSECDKGIKVISEILRLFFDVLKVNLENENNKWKSFSYANYNKFPVTNYF